MSYNDIALSSTTIADLNQFVLMAKREIGLVKPSDIINDRGYAFNLFIPALFSGNEGLASITRKLSAGLGIGNEIIVAIEAYIKDLKAQDVPEQGIESSKSYLIKLADSIYNIEPNSNSYREAVDAFLVEVGQDEKIFCLHLARSFYRYWMSAMDGIVKTNYAHNQKIGSSSRSFNHLWSNLDEEFLSISEDGKLSYYQKAMQKVTVSLPEMEARIRIAKIITVTLRQYSQTKEGYRKTVNEIVALLTHAEMKDYFLVVSREFHRFCIN